MKDWNWRENGSCGNGLPAGLAVWTTFHLEAAFDRDLRLGGTPGGQDGWPLAAWIPLGTQSVPALVTDPSPLTEARRYLGLGWLGLMAAHGCWGRHGGGGVLLTTCRRHVCSALLRPPLAVLPRLCALPAGLSVVS